jgi:hypothetical protein
MLDFLKLRDTLPYGLEVGQHSAEPSFSYERHVAANGLFHDAVFDLLFGSHEKDFSALLDFAFNALNEFIQAAEGFIQIDDVNTVARTEDKALHFRIPTLCLVPEMGPGFQKVLQCQCGHKNSFKNVGLFLHLHKRKRLLLFRGAPFFYYQRV